MSVRLDTLLRVAASDLTPDGEVADRASRALDDPATIRAREATYAWRVALGNLVCVDALLRAFASLADWEGARVLDAGCGPGVISNALLDLGVTSVTAIDRSPRMLAAGEALDALTDRRIRPLRCDLTDPALDLGRFDIVLCGDVPTSPSVLRTLERLVCPGGRLLATVSGLAGGCRLAHDRELELRARLSLAAGFRDAGPAWSSRPTVEPFAGLRSLDGSGYEIRTAIAETTGPLPASWSRLQAERFATFEGPFQWPHLSAGDREGLCAAYEPGHAGSLAARATAYCAETVTVAAVTR